MKLTMDKKFEVLKAIEQHGEHADNEGESTWTYEDGWNDTRIAKECGVQPREAARYRGMVFGKLTRPAFDGSIMKALEKRVTVLEDQLCVVLRELEDAKKLQNPVAPTLLPAPQANGHIEEAN
jgi:hypothetical protein